MASFWARQVALGEAALEDEELVDVVVLRGLLAGCCCGVIRSKPYVEVVVVVMSVVVVLEDARVSHALFWHFHLMPILTWS